VAPAVPHSPGSWRLIYFDAPNRGEQVRILFALANTPWVDVRVHPYPEGLDPYKKAEMGDDSPLCGTDKCPAVTAPDGIHCVETAEIMRFVGRRVGMAPAAESAADAKAMEVTLLAQEVLDQVFYGLLMKVIIREVLGQQRLSWVCRLVFGKEEAYVEKPLAKLTASLQQFEAALETSGGPYICGSALTYADVAVFHVLNESLAFVCFDKAALLAPHPKLSALMADLEGKTAAWIEKRVSEHQMGIRSTVEFFAVTNTPFPWSKRTKTYPEVN